jgi:phospholipid transport system transporter-binding protein
MKLDAAEITNDNAAALIEIGTAAIRAGDLTIDLSAVTKVDSAAVALLLEWQRAATAIGRKLSFVSVPPALCSLATLYGMDEVLGTPAVAKAPGLTAIHPTAHHPA